MTYFEVFSLPAKLHINTAALEKHFYAQSRKLHPDRFASKPVEQQEAALAQSSLLNDAYRTLKDPIKRTQYLLKLEGVELEEQSKSATEQARTTGEAKKQIVPPDLLEEVFELNMQLEEWRMHKKMGEDDPSLKQEIEKQKATLETKHESMLEELKTYWNEWDALLDGPEAAPVRRSATIGQMVDVLNRRNYIRNLVRDVNAAIEA